MSGILLGFFWVVVHRSVQPTIFQGFLHWPWVVSSQAANGTLWISGTLCQSVCLPPTSTFFSSTLLCIFYRKRTGRTLIFVLSIPVRILGFIWVPLFCPATWKLSPGNIVAAMVGPT